MRMLLRPRWLLTHLVVLSIVVLFVNLGFWQLRRLEERRVDNARITANMSAEQQPLDQTLQQYGNDPDALAYRRVTVSGTYRPDDEVLLTPRSNGRVAGHHVLTPLLLDGDQAVLVDRGWVPFADDDPPIAAAAPPDGRVTVTGVIIPTQEAARFGSAGAAERVTYLSGPDVDLLQPQMPVALHPFSVLLASQEPAPDGLPVAGPLPEVDEGSHQAYAWQWFSFAAILLGGYPLLLRRSLASARQRAARTDQVEGG